MDRSKTSTSVSSARISARGRSFASGHELSVGPQEPSLTLGLRAIEARASYNVSVAHGYAAGKAEAMAGAKLAGLAVALEPSTSVVVRYHAM